VNLKFDNDRCYRTSLEVEMTFEEIGNVLGVTRQRAEQIYRSALNKLRKLPRAVVEDWLEQAAALKHERAGRETATRYSKRTSSHEQGETNFTDDAAKRYEEAA
jgi:Sigma-70, region 4